MNGCLRLTLAFAGFDDKSAWPQWSTYFRKPAESLLLTSLPEKTNRGYNDGPIDGGHIT